MKKIILSVFSLCGIATLQAQQVSDMVSMGANYTNNSYYSLENGEVSNINSSDWDIALNTSIFGVDIRINGGLGVELYAYPNGDTSDFSTLDTTGITSWKQSYNSSKSWDQGAFNANANGGSFDYGWGIYNSVTHAVTGDSVYVIKTIAGDYKKLWIQSLAGGNYNFKYANLNNSGLTKESIQLSTYSSKNYFYYSLDNATVIDREPASADWDFVAIKYMGLLQPQNVYYPVTGILTNRGIKTREARNIDVTVAEWGDFAEEEIIDVIGSDWKAFNMGTYTYDIEAELSYFMTDKSGNIWQVIFTDFGGSANGNIEFTKEMISAVSIDENAEINLGIYPNPASDQVNFLYDNFNEELATISIYDLQGKFVYSEQFSGQGFNKQNVDVSYLNSGVYTVTIKSNNRIGSQKLFIK